MYRYAQTRNRVHRVHVEGGRAFVIERCNLDDARYFGLDEVEPAGIHCAYCWFPPDQAATVEEGAQTVPAVSKQELPRSLVLLPRRVFVALVGVIALALLLTGTTTGVVLSPDPEPSPTFTVINPDWLRWIEIVTDARIAEHRHDDHAADHTHEVTPSPTPTPSTTSATAAPTPADPTATPTRRPRSTAPTASSRPTAPPPPPPTPTVTDAPSASPSPTPCFRPGDPQSGHDPCGWPPDDKS